MYTLSVDASEYRLVEDWEQAPRGIAHRDVADVAVDSHDRVYLLTRMEPRVIVYERDGGFVRCWGEGELSDRPHGITIGPDDTVYIVDESSHIIRIYTSDGELRTILGNTDKPSETGVNHSLADLYDRIASIERSGAPFNKPTKLAVAPNGDLYVSDGYGNSCVHRFDATGRLLTSWGEPGTGDGQFHLPHSVAVAPDERVYVVDRENERVQVFGPDGEFQAQWRDFHRPAGLSIRGDRIYVTELSRRPGYRSWSTDAVHEFEPARLSILDLDGQLLARWQGWDGKPAHGAATFAAPHGVCVDSYGSIYLAQVTYSDLVRLGLAPENTPTFAKLELVA